MTPDTTTATATGTTKHHYKGARPTWCPGCGDYGVLASLDKALQAYGRPEWEIVVVSGIGCSSRFPFFMNTYGFHSAHGRALAVATGLKLARPELTVVCTGGDGDALAIGGNHFFHTMRRNVDLTYILMDNQIYGMTKGQTAPTSAVGMATKSSPYGNIEPPVDPCWAALTMGATFVAQTASHDPAQMTALILEALHHPGMAFVNCLAPCITFNEVMDKDYFKAHGDPLPPDWDPTDFEAAVRLLRNANGRFPLGLIHRRREPTLGERLEQMTNTIRATAGEVDVMTIARQFL
jgi:2-oxoglutarate ferredoxin oxidoreductase subunit beta